MVRTFEAFIGPEQRAARRHAARWLTAAAVAALMVSDAAAAAARQPKPAAAPAARAGAAAPAKLASVKRAKGKAVAERAKHGRASSREARAVPLPLPRPALADLPPEAAAVRQALDFARQGKLRDATAIEASLTDPVARTLVEWLVLRRGDNEAGFERYAAFLKAHPEWPSIGMLRRRAEARLWQERRDAATVRGFVGAKPAGVVGELALARVLMSAGDRTGAEQKVRAAWRAGELSAETEASVLEVFPDVLTRADHAARMDRRLGAKDFSGAMRAARRAGDGHVGSEIAVLNAVGFNSNSSTPEPGTLGLLGGSLTLLAAIGFRRRRSSK